MSILRYYSIIKSKSKSRFVVLRHSLHLPDPHGFVFHERVFRACGYICILISGDFNIIII